MKIYHFEANGKTNTGEYVENILHSISNLNPKVFTSFDSFHREKAIPAFSRYGLTSNVYVKIFYYLIGWSRVLIHVLKLKDQRGIFHTHWFRLSPVDFLFLFLISKLTKLKIVHTVHNVLPHEPKFYDFYFHKHIYKITNGLIFHNKSNLTEFEEKFHSEAFKTVIPHYSYIPGKGISKSIIPNSILFFGNIRPYKGLEIFLEAIKGTNNLYLTVAGQAEYDISHLQEHFKNINWEIGWVAESRLAELFTSHQIVVLPYTRIDNSGLIHLAMSYGKAIIASDLKMFGEIIRNHSSGLLFKNGDANDLKRKIDNLVNNTELIAQLGSGAKEVMENKHSLESIGKCLDKFYKIVVK